MAGLGLAAFAAAFTAMLGAQIALVSFLDPVRADAAAREVASSDVAALLVERAVRSSVGPALDPAASDAVVAAALADPRIRDVVRMSLADAHRQLAGHQAGALAAENGNQLVGSTITDVIEQIGRDNGIELTGILAGTPDPSVVPVNIPRLNLISIAERVRLLAGFLAFTAAAVVLMVHPRRGLGMSSLGMRAAVATAIWLAGMLSAGWLLGSFGGSLLGDVLQRMWTASMGGVSAVLIAVLVLSFGVWLGGRAVDGLTRRR